MMKVQKDKLQHFAVCFILAAIVSFVIALMTKNVLAAMFAGASSGMALGVGKEYGDKFAAGNHFCYKDLTADALGAVVGSLAGLFALLI